MPKMEDGLFHLSNSAGLRLMKYIIEADKTGIEYRRQLITLSCGSFKIFVEKKNTDE